MALKSKLKSIGILSNPYLKCSLYSPSLPQDLSFFNDFIIDTISDYIIESVDVKFLSLYVIRFSLDLTQVY